MYNPGTHANHWAQEPYAAFDDAPIGQTFFSHRLCMGATFW
ncbi:MAG: hypothetical protein U0T56_07050 [Ferruginibacter sp.]